MVIKSERNRELLADSYNSPTRIIMEEVAINLYSTTDK